MDRLTVITSIEEITDTPSLELLYDKWLDLWKRSFLSTPFQSPDWIIPWWKIFGTERLFVLCIIHNDRLIGLAPFYVYRLKGTEIRQLTLIGTGNTDYLDIIAEDGYERQVADAVASYLILQSQVWDLCYFQGLLEWSILRNFSLPGNFAAKLMSYNVYPETALPDSFENYIFSLSSDFRKKIKYARNSLEKSGRLTFELANNETRHEFLNDLFYLHKKSWSFRNESGVLNGSKIREFHERVTDGLLKNDILRFYRLRHNNRTIAATYGMKSGKIFYSYLNGFDPELKKYSPGSILILFMMEDLIKQGIETFDFMMGGEAYKYRWGARDKAVYKMIINK